MSHRWIACAFVALGLAACRADDAGGPSDPGDPSAAGTASRPIETAARALEGELLPDSQWNHFGAGVRRGETTPVASVLEDPGGYSGESVRVRGPIESVCKVKGCWVRVGTGEKNMLVRFKDYGFFLPKDAEGEIVLEGSVQVEEISVEMRRHYLEDEGRHDEAAKITEPETKVTFTAVGAAIRAR